MVEVDKRDFRRRFPNLAEELESGKGTYEVTNVNGEIVTEKGGRDPFSGYTPTAIDYLRRCDNESQAEETINYLAKKGEISKEYADQLRKVLKDHGLRGFGPKREDDYYLRKAGYS